MPDFDRSVILEALSALTGVEVKLLNDPKGKSITSELTIDNFLSTVYGSMSEWSLTSLFDALSLSSSSAQSKEMFVDIKDFLDPRYDYDFRSGSDSGDSKRGDEAYSRPWGWYRVALKVRDKYPDGNTWLGPDGWRSNSAPGEWPVSFHGTSIEGAKAIASSHYKAGPRQLYGRGIYSTPDIDTAYGFTTEFKSKNGKTYSVIMQNRINPSKRVIIKDRPDFWLIPVPEGTSADKEKEIVEASIRPYGILIKEVEAEKSDTCVIS